jgi:hypothetical protein
MPDPAQIAPMVEYIRHQKYEDRFVFHQPGVATNIGPAEPNFTMRGRTVDALMRAMIAWRRQPRDQLGSRHAQPLAHG